MLTKSERRALSEIVGTARKLLTGEVGPIKGAEIIARLSHQTSAIEPELFAPFVDINRSSYESVIRDPSLWAPSFIAEQTLSREAFEGEVAPRIPAYGDTLLAVCVPLLNECPVCTFEGDVPPYDATGEPSYQTCRACGFFFDTLDTEYDWGEWRRRWIAKGMPFACPPAPIAWEPPRSFRTG